MGDPVHNHTLRSMVIVLLLFAVIGGIAGFLWAAPRWTATDRDRVVAARMEPYQQLNLKDFEDATPSHYYVDMRLIAQYVREGEYAKPPGVDAAGIPFIDHTHDVVVTDLDSATYDPITISQYALGRYEEYLHGEEAAITDFLIQAEWLRDHLEHDGTLPIGFAVPSRDLEPGWISAMAQGEAISVFVRAYVETADEEYLAAALSAFEPFTRSVQEGGVTCRDEAGTWLEEYPQYPPSHVLNGEIYAAFGLCDLLRVTDDDIVRELLDDTADTLVDNLYRYEHDGWVIYELGSDQLAGKTYYPLQIDQLRALGALVNDDRITSIANRWAEPLEHESRWLIKRSFVRARERIEAKLGD